MPVSAEASPPAIVPLEAIKDLDAEFYTIKPGDSLIRVIKSLYDIPKKDLHNEYLDLLKKINPSIRDLNSVYPGQKVKLPIYSPKVVKLPIKKVPPPRNPRPKKPRKTLES